MFKILSILIACFFLNSTKVFSQKFEFKVDSLLTSKYQSDAPGATFLIAEKGNIIYQKAFGLSNLELKTPMKINQVFELGSITKQFTAIAILMLAEKGKLHLSDTLDKYIFDYPNGNKITIHHLLTHTSGVKNFTSVKGLHKIEKEDLSPEELINFFKNEPIDFAPGEAFKYSNSGYVLLGHIIEQVSGEKYSDFISQHIFKTLGMTNSYYASNRNVIENRASGYNKKNGEYKNNRYISFNIPYAEGSLMSTTVDMFKWQKAITNNLLINQKTTQNAFTNYTLNTNKQINYGYGWHIRTIDGMQSFEHGGSIMGFKSMGIYLPESDIYIIGLSNCDCNSPTKVVKEIASLAINK